MQDFTRIKENQFYWLIEEHGYFSDFYAAFEGVQESIIKPTKPLLPKLTSTSPTLDELQQYSHNLNYHTTLMEIYASEMGMWNEQQADLQEILNYSHLHYSELANADVKLREVVEYAADEIFSEGDIDITRTARLYNILLGMITDYENNL